MENLLNEIVSFLNSNFNFGEGYYIKAMSPSNECDVVFCPTLGYSITCADGVVHHAADIVRLDIGGIEHTVAIGWCSEASRQENINFQQYKLCE